MPAPVARYKILPARGDLAALTAAIADIAEGEIAYAIDQDLYYQKQGGVLEPVGVPEAPQDGTQYVRNNAAWEAVDVPPGTVVGDTPPESPDQGQQWYDTGTARLFLWTGSEWVDASPDAESASFLVSETAPENANEGDGWFNESNGKTYVYVDGVWVQSTHTDMALLDGSVTPAKLSPGGPSWDSSGSVGIGTTTPGFGAFSKGLHVSDSAANAGVRVETTAGIGGILEMYAEPGGATFDTRGSGFIRFNNASTELARFTSDGTFLINRSQRQGVLPYAVELHSDAVNALDQPAFTGFSHSNTSPSYTAYLQLIRDRNGGRTLNTDVLGMVRFCGNDGVNGAVSGAEISSKAIGDTAAGGCRASLVLSTNDGSSLGTSTKLEISPDGIIETFAKAGSPNFTMRNGSASSSPTVFIQGLHSASSAGTGGTASFYVFANGNVQNTNNSYTAISDITLKENIIPACEQWDNIKDIEIVNYNFKEETGHQTHKQLGVIAQQVEKVSPGLVNTNEEGLKSVNYSILYMKSVKALQEAMARIESLETRIAQLEA